MSVESARKFTERIKQDEELAEKLRNCSSTEERKEIIKAEGFDFTAEEIQAVKDELVDDAVIHITSSKEKNKKGKIFNMDLSVPFTNFNLKINI